MQDARIEKLAEGLINYSVRLQKGEKVLIEAVGIPNDLVRALVKKAYAAGGFPYTLNYSWGSSSESSGISSSDWGNTSRTGE